MKVHVTIATGGRVVSDDKAMEFAEKYIGSDNIVIGTSVMLDAFRVLRKRGDIEELTVTFTNGETLTTDKNGTFEDWPHADLVVNVGEMLLAELISWNDKD